MPCYDPSQAKCHLLYLLDKRTEHGSIFILYQMNNELIDTSKMDSLDMDTISNNRQHYCSISLSTITTADTEDRVEDNMSLEELRACLNIEASNKKKLQRQIQKSDTNDKEARRIRRIQKREEKKRLKNIEFVHQWDVFFQDFNLLDSTATQQIPIPKSDIAKKDDIDDSSIPTQRSKRQRTISLSSLSKSLSIRRGRNRKNASLSKSSKSITDILSFITGSTAKQ